MNLTSMLCPAMRVFRSKLTAPFVSNSIARSLLGLGAGPEGLGLQRMTCRTASPDTAEPRDGQERPSESTVSGPDRKIGLATRVFGPTVWMAGTLGFSPIRPASPIRRLAALGQADVLTLAYGSAAVRGRQRWGRIEIELAVGKCKRCTASGFDAHPTIPAARLKFRQLFIKRGPQWARRQPRRDPSLALRQTQQEEQQRQYYQSERDGR